MFRIPFHVTTLLQNHAITPKSFHLAAKHAPFQSHFDHKPDISHACYPFSLFDVQVKPLRALTLSRKCATGQWGVCTLPLFTLDISRSRPNKIFDRRFLTVVPYTIYPTLLDVGENIS